MSGPRGIHMSGAQVIASVLATLTGAIAASYLGVGGTLVGAAVGSLASTMGTEVYKHYLLRSQQRLRAAGQVLYQSAARTRTGSTTPQPGARASSGGRHTASQEPAAHQETARDLADRETAVWDRRQYGAARDPHETQMIPGLAAQRRGAPDGGAPTGSAPYGSAPSGAGRAGGTASQHAHGDFTGEGPVGQDAGRGGIWAAFTSFFAGLTRRQWLTYGGIAAGFFLVVLASITVFELTIGKPVGAVVWGRHASGTSVGDTLTGQGQPHQKATTHPSSTSSATPSGSTPASPTPSAGSSSGTPTPSTSVTPASPSTVPSATPSTGSTGAGSTAAATPAP